MTLDSRTVPGQYPWAFKYADGTLAAAYVDGRPPQRPRPDLVVDAYVDGHWIEKHRAPTADGCMHLSAAVSDHGVVCVVGCTEHTDELLIWLSTVGWLQGLGFGQRTPIVQWVGDSFVVLAPAREPYSARQIRVSESGEMTSVDIMFDGSSSGYLRWDGPWRAVTYNDGHRMVLPDGSLLFDAQRSGGVLAGMDGYGHGLQAIIEDARFHVHFTVDPRDPPMNPSVAGDEDKFLACSWLRQAQVVAMTICTPPYVSDPPIVVDPPLEPPVLAPIGTRLTCCYPGNFGVQVDAPGNALMVSSQADLERVLAAGDARLLLAYGVPGIDAVVPYWARVWGVLVDGESGGQTVRQNVEVNAGLARERIAARSLTPRPILAYQQDLVERIPGVDLPLLQSYWDHEPAAADYATWLQDRAAVLGPFILCGQGHDRRTAHAPDPTWTEAALCRLQARHDEAARHPDCRGVLWFAYLREGGLVCDPPANEAGPTCHPVELRWVRAICAACETPTIEEDDVAITDDDVKRIADAVAARIVPSAPPEPAPVDVPDVHTMQLGIAAYDATMESLGHRHLSQNEVVHLVRMKYVEGHSDADVEQTIRDWVAGK